MPIAEWLRGPLRGLESQLEQSWLYRDGWFDREGARRLIQEHLSGVADYGDALWPLYTLGCWSPS